MVVVDLRLSEQGRSVVLDADARSVAGVAGFGVETSQVWIRFGMVGEMMLALCEGCWTVVGGKWAFHEVCLLRSAGRRSRNMDHNR